MRKKGHKKINPKNVAYDRFVFKFKNKTGLQPVSRPVEQVYYFGGWVEGAKSL